MQKLEMINRMLAAVGENPVTDADSQHPSAIKARTTLATISKLVQAGDWAFNMDKAILLTPDIQGSINLPEGTLFFDPIGDDQQYVERAKKVYDRVNHTFVFTAGLYADLRVELAPEDCPEPIAQYITAYAVWQFYVDDEGDEGKADTYIKERERQRILATKYDLKIKDVNIQDRPAVARLLSRVRPASGYVSQGNPVWPGGR